MDLGEICGGTRKKVESKEKGERKERPSRFCANDWSLVVFHYLLRTLGQGVNQVFCSRRN